MKKGKKLRLIMKGDIRLFIFQQMVDLNMISLVKLAVSLRRFNMETLRISGANRRHLCSALGSGLEVRIMIPIGNRRRGIGIPP